MNFDDTTELVPRTRKHISRSQLSEPEACVAVVADVHPGKTLKNDATNDSDLPLEPIGDFQVLRELGRGGMPIDLDCKTCGEPS